MFKAPKPVGMSLNLAPMVDVMMCLIIFFLLASKLVDAEHQPLKLAYALAAKEVDRSELGSRVTVNIRPSQQDADKADYVVVEFDGTDISERVLQPGDLDRYLKVRADRAQERKEELRCVIRADQNVQYQHVEVVLRACGLTGYISKIVFSAKHGEDPEDGV